MVSDNQPEWLPPDWVEVKDKIDGRVEYYHNTYTGQTIFTKEDVIRYISMANISNSPPQQMDEDNDLDTKAKTVMVKNIENPEWLPRGWTTELRSRDSGKLIKCFVHPEGKLRFYSKPQVFRYLETVNSPATKEGPNVGYETGENSSQRYDASQRDGIPEWLPQGWTMEIKVGRGGTSEGRKYKCYIAPESGHKCFSKPQVYDYLKTLNRSPAMHEGPNVVNGTGENSSSGYDASQRDGIPEWLPQGWTMEMKVGGGGTSEGRKYKYYVAPGSGHKCYSKPQVYAYLKTLNSSPAGQEGVQQSADQLSGDKCSSQADVSEDCKSISIKRSITKSKKAGDNSPSLENNKVIERGQADGLPPGWIREIRTRKSGVLLKKDPYFIDPSSGYEFRSKRDALRYLETGNIKVCAIRPQRVVVNDTACINDTELSKEEILSNVVNETGEKSSPGYDASQSDGIPEWLPQGWTMEMKFKGSGTSKGKKYKCYIAPGSGRKFFSKPQVYDYLKTQNSSPVGQERVQQRDDQLSGDKCSSEPDVSEDCKSISIEHSITKPKKACDSSPSLENNKVIERGPADGLPPGWIRETRTRKSGALLKKDPHFIDTSSGYEFRSRRDALRYLETGNIEDCAYKPRREVVNDTARINDSESIKEDISVVERASVDGLPPGWIKEVRSKKVGSRMRKDPYFIDPLSGYEFRSKPDALRYLETGDINNCAIKPKGRNSKGIESISRDNAGKLLASETVENNGERTETHSNKSKNKTTMPLTPGRSSKRLKGAVPEIIQQTT